MHVMAVELFLHYTKCVKNISLIRVILKDRVGIKKIMIIVYLQKTL